MMQPIRLVTLMLVVLVGGVVGQEYDYSFGSYEDTYDDFRDAEHLYEQDTYGYYQDDEAHYYEYYGIYDDQHSYDDYLMDGYEEDLQDDCVLGKDGKPVVRNGTVMCPIKVSGVDSLAKDLKGGIDGVYKLVSCHHGKPLYRREGSPSGEERAMWYSYASADWDISRGAEPNEGDILLYGDERDNAALPFAVKKWSILVQSPVNHTGSKQYKPLAVDLSCADGTKIDKAQVQKMTEKPKLMLTDDEIEKKYKYIYDQGAKRATPSPTVNFTVVVLMVMTGLTFVLAIPYFLIGRRRKGGKPAQPFSGSLATAISASKKRQSGRSN